MKVLNILLIIFVSQYMLVLVVSGTDVTCKAGEGAGTKLPTGFASQCGGSKLYNIYDCKAAAKYDNKGYYGNIYSSDLPYGCIFWRGQYRWNYNGQPTSQCSTECKCICKTKKCFKCPINTYNNKGGLNPTCTRCPYNRPTTNFKTTCDGYTINTKLFT